MPKELGRCWAVVGLALAVAGCRSDESTCETLCEWLDQCVAESDANCSDQAEIDECVEDLEGFSDDCDDAVSGFADCLEDNDVECSDVESNCQGEAAEFLEQCEGEFESDSATGSEEDSGGVSGGSG
jgi:hypothetical protein